MHHHHHQGHFLSDYEILGFLGQGTYGRVVKVKSKQSSQIFAAKIISLEGLSPNELHRTHEEQRIHSSLRHPNIISVYQSYLEVDQLIIVMEFCEYGDLGYYIKKKNEESGFFSEELIMNLFIQVAFGLKYLHENKIVHRDIKPSNIFVDSEGRVKVADFGLSKSLTQSQSQGSLGLQALVGTPLYLAPQICANQSPSFKADIWAVGCVLYELCTLKPPFVANNILALATMIAQKDVPGLHERYSDDLNALAHWMLDKSSNNRPSAEQILKLSFVNSYTIIQEERPSTPDLIHHNYQEDELERQLNKEFPILQHKGSMQEEDRNDYRQKLIQNLVKLLGSEQSFHQMYEQIKVIKDQNIIINKKDEIKIVNQLLQIYGEEYVDIAKGVAECIDLERMDHSRL